MGSAASSSVLKLASEKKGEVHRKGSENSLRRAAISRPKDFKESSKNSHIDDIRRGPVPMPPRIYPKSFHTEPIDGSKPMTFNSLPGVAMAAKSYVQTKKKASEEIRAKIIEEHPELVDALERVDKMMTVMQQSLEEEISRKTLRMKTTKYLMKLSSFCSDYEDKEQRKILGNELAKKGGGHVFTEYMRMLTSNGEKTPISGPNFENLSLLRSVCCNYSDASLPLCDEFGRMGMLPMLGKDLKTFKDSYKHDSDIQDSTVIPVLSILHNCAKSTDNKKHFQQMKAVDSIFPYISSDEKEIKMIAMLTLAHIVDDKDRKVISVDESLIESIMEFLQNAMEHESHIYEGISVHDLLSGLMHLAEYDENSTTIVNMGLLSFLVQLMKEGSDEEKAIAAKNVWVLSFRNENKEKILLEEKMDETLEKLSHEGDS